MGGVGPTGKLRFDPGNAIVEADTLPLGHLGGGHSKQRRSLSQNALPCSGESSKDRFFFLAVKPAQPFLLLIL